MTGGSLFALFMLLLFVGLIVFVILLGVFHPRSGADVLDWRPTRSAEQEVQLELDDVDQMLEAANARRRARGDEELTEAGLQARVQEDQRERVQRAEELRRDRAMTDQEIAEVLEVKNERRRRLGRPELDEAEFRRRIGAPPRGTA